MMTQTQEFTGKNVDIAINNACSALSLQKEELKYVVVSEGTSGIFGIVGRKDAKIRVTLPETKSAEDKEGILSIVDEAFGGEVQKEEPVKPKTPDNNQQKEDGRYYSKERYPYKNNYEIYGPPAEVTEESKRLGLEVVQKMADLITDDAKVTMNTHADRLILNINGGNTGILIGKKGQTLDAMQFLTDKIINRKSDDRVRVKIDIEGYMETRKNNLEHLALKMADRAKKTGRPATINQISSQDRRIVHMVLRKDPQIRTQSVGDGYYRRLVVFPKRKPHFRSRKRFNSQ